MPGTGGHFVASLLHNAKLGKTEISNMSEGGNCHDTEIRLKAQGGIFDSLDGKIYGLKLLNLPFDSDTTYYWPLHDKDIDNVMQEFDKCIKITYTKADFPEINAAFYYKWGVEGKNITHTYNRFRRRNTVFLTEHNKFFLPSFEYGDRILNISWYELYHSNDLDGLIKKFGDFTGIDTANFSKEVIVRWRTLTHFGFSKIGQ